MKNLFFTVLIFSSLSVAHAQTSDTTSTGDVCLDYTFRLAGSVVEQANTKNKHSAPYYVIRPEKAIRQGGAYFLAVGNGQNYFTVRMKGEIADEKCHVKAAKTFEITKVFVGSEGSSFLENSNAVLYFEEKKAGFVFDQRFFSRLATLKPTQRLPGQDRTSSELVSMIEHLLAW